LTNLYGKYNIDGLSYGKLADALGDMYEEYVREVFSDQEITSSFLPNGEIITWDDYLVHSICAPYGISHIDSVDFPSISKRESGGSPKTDIALLINEQHLVKLTIKQSSAKNVTAAEFDVETIKREVGIHNKKVLSLVEKHQSDGSAINFLRSEKEELKDLLEHLNIKEKLVRWVLSGSSKTDDNEDIRVANHSLMFKINKSYLLQHINSYPIEQCVERITHRSSGFGTGLSWTFATGSKGKKIQFKCPVF